MDHDRLFKLPLTTFFFEFVDLLLQDVGKYLSRDKVDFLDKEIFTDLTGGERYEVDIVVKWKFKGSDTVFVILVEDQAKPHGHFPRRMFHYFARLDQEYDVPVYPVALLTYDSPRRPQEDRYRVVFPDKTVLDFNFTQPVGLEGLC